MFDLLIKYQLNEAYNIKYSVDGNIGNIKGNEIEKEKNIELKGKVILDISKIKAQATTMAHTACRNSS